MALPTIGTRHGGIPEIIIAHDETGFLVREHDVLQLGRHLTELLTDAQLRASMGRQARAKMEREYDLHQQVARLEELCDLALRRGPGRPT